MKGGNSVRREIFKHQLKSAIYGLAVGDALGVPYFSINQEEMCPKEEISMIKGGTHDKPEGTWSDETSLTLILLDSLSDKRFSLKNLIENSLNWFEEGEYTIDSEAFGIEPQTLSILTQLSEGSSLRRVLREGDLNDGNSALIKILPLAFWLINEPSIKKRKKMIDDICSITNSDDISKLVCHYYVEFAIQLVNGNDMNLAYSETNRLMRKHYGGKQHAHLLGAFEMILTTRIAWVDKTHIKADDSAIHTLEAVIWSLINSTGYENCMKRAVSLGGNTDTIAAVVGGLAGIFYGYERIPKRWLEQLRGKDILDGYIEKFSDRAIENL